MQKSPSAAACTKRTLGRCHSGLSRIRISPALVLSATTRTASKLAFDGTGCDFGLSFISAPEVQGVVPPTARVSGLEGSSTHLSQHWSPHHASVHATQMLQPRVVWQSLQQSAGDLETVAPTPVPGTMTAPSYSVWT